MNLENETKNLVNKFIDKNKIIIPNGNKDELVNILAESVKFNRKIDWKNKNRGLVLGHEVSDVLDYFVIRAEIYKKMGYNKEFKPIIPNIECDNYDNNSIFILRKKKDEVIGGLRIIKNTGLGFPTTEKLGWENLGLNPSDKIGESSRLVVKENYKGKDNISQFSTREELYINGLLKIFKLIDIDKVIGTVPENVYPWYKNNFQNVEQLLKVSNYGEIKKESVTFLLYLNN
jgi:N-acyl-L-homoserine lactone synthetase